MTVIWTVWVLGHGRPVLFGAGSNPDGCPQAQEAAQEMVQGVGGAWAVLDIDVPDDAIIDAFVEPDDVPPSGV